MKDIKKKIYLARQENTNLFKIGISKNPKNRILTLQTGNANKIILIETFETKHGFNLETALHQDFYKDRLEGEWFELNENQIKTFLPLCKEKESLFDFMKKNNYYWNK